MSRNCMLPIGIATIWLTIVGVLAISAQDKYSVKVPNGLPLSDFRVSFAKIGSGGHLECAAVMKPLRHTATSPEQP
jgi:uncharacterized membrane protein